ncbi:MAG: hypothetical protein WB763_14835, partial [Terriglobia bacterium]
MRFNASFLGLGKVILCLAMCSTALSAREPASKEEDRRAATALDPCRENDFGRPVLLYDANTRTARIVFKGDVRRAPDAYGVFPLAALPQPPPRFLCDGRPAEVWIANRRLKQVFSVTTTSVFVLSSGLPELRGMPSAPAVAQPTAAPAAAPSPAAKGGLAGPTTLTTDAVVGYLLNEETFDRPFQRLQDDAATVKELRRFLKGLFDQYNSKLDSLTGGITPATIPSAPPPPKPPLPPPVPPAPLQGEATLGGTTTNFVWETASINASFFPTPPHHGVPLEQAESEFDQLTGQINQIVADVQRINAKIQNYPVVDVLVNLRSQVDTYEDSVRLLNHEYQNINAAITILHDLRQIAKEYLRQRNAAEIRVLLTQRYAGSTPVLDAPTIARIVDLYMNQGKEPSSYIDRKGRDSLEDRLCGLRQDMQQFSIETRSALQMPKCTVLTKTGTEDCRIPYQAEPCLPGNTALPCVENDGFPDWGTGDSLQLVEIPAANAKLDTLRHAIVDLNSAEAQTFAAINAVYDTYRAPLIPLNVDLQSNSGNLMVFYSITGTEQFQRYRVTNETLQPQSACVQTLAAGNGSTPGTPNCTTAASGTATSTATTSAATAPAAPATTASATTPPSPPADFYGRFEVHHFVRGALVSGLAYDSIGNRSYSWVACPSPPSSGSGPSGACYSQAPATSNPTPPTSYQLLQSNSPQAAVVVGVSIFIKREDMFPGVKAPWWQRYLPTEPFLGASVYPLNHYFVGGSLEPIHGFNLTLGPVFGSQASLPPQYTPGEQVTGTTAPTVPISSRFRKCGFRGKVGTIPKSSRAAFRNELGHDSGMKPGADSDFKPVTF